MNNLYLIKSGDNGFVEETSAVISAEGGDISINSSLHVDSAGNIGIGSSNPTNKLDVVGSASISNDLTVDNIIFTNVGGQSPSAANDIIKYDGNSWVVAAASTLPGGGGGAGNSDVPAGLITNLTQGNAIHEVKFGFEEDGSRIVYDNVPKIAASLEIDGPGEIIPHTVSGVSESGYFVVFSEELPTANYRMHTVFGGTDAFWETGVSNLEYSERNVEIDRSLYVGQNVGIGTTQPPIRLTVDASTTDVSALFLSNDAGSYISFMDNSTTDLSQALIGAQGNDLSMHAGSEPRMHIKADGNVGIGTTSPGTNKLDVQGALSVGSTAASTSVGYINVQGYRATSDQGLLGHVKFDNQNGGNTAGKIEVYAGGSATTGTMRFHTSGSEKMRITSGGKVGIGTTNPVDELHINSSDSNVNLRLTRDTDTGGRISCSDGADTPVIIFETIDSGNRSEKMRIDSDGNVGIGTANPNLTGLQLGTALVVSSATGGDIVAHKSGSSVNVGDICGSLLIANSDTDGAEDHFVGMWGKASSTNGSQNLHLAAGRSGYEVDAPHMTILSDGNVGIGTTNPSGLFHLKGDTNNNGAELFLQVNNNNTTDTLGAIHFGNNINSTLTEVLSGTSGANDSSFLTLSTSNGGDLAERMRIDSDGNVGIGTTNPSAKTVIKSGVNSLPKSDISTDTGTALRILGNDEAALDFGATGRTNNGGVGQWIQSRHSANDSTYYNLLLNPLGGNVGIGTTNPLYETHIETTGKACALAVRAEGMTDSIGWGGYIFANAKVGSTGWSTVLGTYRPTTSVNFASTLRMAPRTGSNQYFYIDTSANLIMSASTANIGSSSGTVVGTQTSDERLKNIEPDFEYGLEQVMQLQPIAYTFKDDEGETRCLGFGAQTTQDIIPEVVYDTQECIDGYDADPEDEDKQIPRSEDTKFAMKYVELVPVLTKAIQEQQQIIEDLKSRIENLEQ